MRVCLCVVIRPYTCTYVCKQIWVLRGRQNQYVEACAATEDVIGVRNTITTYDRLLCLVRDRVPVDFRPELF